MDERSAAPRNETTLELLGDREILILREFRAVPRIVFEAWTRPELVQRWWAPKSLGAKIKSSTADVNVGGQYRYVTTAGGGGEFAFRGIYREVVPHSRLVYTQVMEPHADDDALLITVTFEQKGPDTTLLTSRTLCPSAQIRDLVLASGMERGMRETMEQLQALASALSGDELTEAGA